MNIEERIEYSEERMKQALDSALDELNTFRYDRQLRAVLGDGFINKLSAWEQDIRNRKNDPFTVVVIGDFKRGKSTLINALLGEEVVTTDVTTETVTLNRISYGAHGNEAVLSGNRRIRLSDGELKREELERVIGQLGEPVTRLEMKRPCDILKKITIIDTPGTGDAMKDFSDMVKESLLQADAVIYVYNVQYPLSRSEQMFLKSAVLPQRFTRLFLVGNYADNLETKVSYDRMKKLLEDRVHDLLPGTDIIMLSALDELCRLLEEERRETELTPVLEEEFAKFRDCLEKLIEEKADTVVLDRMQRLLKAMAKDLNEELDSIDEGLKMNGEEASDMQKKAEENREHTIAVQSEALEEIAQSIQAMKTETRAWIGEFISRIVEDSRRITNVSVKDLKKYYEFYCIDLMQEAMNTCIDYHQEKLYDYMEEISCELGENISSVFGQKRQYSFRLNLDNRIWTKGDTVGLVTSYAGNLGFLGTVASLVTDGISGAMREKEAETRAPELLEQIGRKLSGLNVSADAAIEKIYGDLQNSAEKLLGDFYDQETKKAEHLLEQTVAIAGKEEEEKEKIRAAVEQARELLKKTDIF